MKIKKASLKDLNKIMEFSEIKNTDIKKWHMNPKDYVKSYIKNPNNFFFVAVNEDNIIGTIGGEIWRDKKFAYLGNIIAKGRDKNKTLINLFNYLIKFCKNNKINLINSFVRKNHSEMITNCKNFGMKKLGKYYYFEIRI